MNKMIKLGLLSTLTIGYSSSYAEDFEFSDDIKVSGYIMFDFDHFESDLMEYNDSTQTSTEIRRARIGFKSNFLDTWQAKIKIDFADETADIKDAYFKYKGFDFANITLGKQKEGFGIERLSSAKDTLFIERSLVTNTIAPGRSIGIGVSQNAQNYNWNIGIYQPDDEENTLAITGRAAWLPWHQDNNLLHLGLSFSERDLNDSDFRINERLEVHSADSLFEGTKLVANKASLQGAEIIWQKYGLTALAEWQQTTVTDVHDIEYDYQGGYIQFGYALSGGFRQYKNGKVGSVNQPGWEITNRYSQFEMMEENRKAKVYSLGVNYTTQNNFKFMANFLKTMDYSNKNKTNKGDAFSLRVQYNF